MKKQITAIIMVLALCFTSVFSTQVTATDTGWHRAGNGYSYTYIDGAKATGLKKIDGRVYYFNSSGVRLTGWRVIGGKVYYFSPYRISGAKKIGNDHYYFNAAGVRQSGLVDVGGNKYYYGSNGKMLTGLKKISGKWYYFNKNMKTGVQKINGSHYYFSSKGVMLTGWQTVNGKKYYYGSNGKMLTGLQKISGSWYYFNKNMKTGVQKINGYLYYFNSTGKMLTGWQIINQKKYYYQSNGKMLTGFRKIDGKYYFLSPSVKTGWQTVATGKKCFFANNGALVTGMKEIDGNTYMLDYYVTTGWKTISGNKYYFGTDGVMLTGLVEINGDTYLLDNYQKTGLVTYENSTYYFDGNGIMTTSEFVTENGVTRYFTVNGKMATGTLSVGTDSYLFGSDGTMLTGWQTRSGNTYYYAEDGKMVTGTVKIDGVDEYFGTKGIWVPEGSDTLKVLYPFSASSINSFGIQTEGNTEIENLVTSCGEVNKNYTTLSLWGTDTSLFYTLNFGGKKDENVTLEFCEVHMNDDAPFSYSIYANGNKVYNRSYEPSSSCENHFFVCVDKSYFDSIGNMNIEIRMTSNGKVRIANIYNYYNLDKLIDSENYLTKMSVGFLSGSASKEKDSIKNTLSSSEGFSGCYAFELKYMQGSAGSVEDRIKSELEVAIKTGLPLAIGTNSWWEGTPGSAYDGIGGCFADMTYQQVMYDPINASGLGNWRLTVPNIWSSTAWLTMSNKVYNSAREKRLKSVCEYIQTIIGEYKAKGYSIPKIYLYTENEPIYWSWPDNTFNSLDQNSMLSSTSRSATADFSTNVINAAKLAGVNLDPTDGISSTEARWMISAMTDYISGVGNAMADGMKYDFMAVNDGQMYYPTTQLVDNTFTQCPINCEWFPDTISNRNSWERHNLNSIRYGWEGASYLYDQRSLDYILTTGTSADVNCERAAVNSSSLRNGILQAYAYGTELYTVYNSNSNEQSKVADYDKYLNTESVPDTYYYDVISLNKNTSKIPDDLVAEESNVAFTTLNGKTVLVPKSCTGSDDCYFTLKLASADFRNSGKIGVYIEGENTLAVGKTEYKIYIGSTTSDMTELKSLDKSGCVYASTVNFTSGDYFYVKIKLYNNSKSQGGAANWLNISKLSIRTKSDTAGSVDGNNYTLTQIRANNTIVAKRADAYRLLDRYEARAGQDRIYTQAITKIRAGKYSSAYALLSESISETLPATYSVFIGGSLGIHPVSLDVSSGGIVKITLNTLSDTSAEFEITANKNTTTATITVSKLIDGNYTLSKTTFNSYVIAKSLLGTAAVNGKVSFKLDQLNTYTQKETPTHNVSGMATGGLTSGKVSMRTHDADYNDYMDYTLFTPSSITEPEAFYRNYGETEFKKCSTTNFAAGDMVELEFDSTGFSKIFITKCATITGTVIAVEEASINGILGETTNPFVTIKESDGTTTKLELGGDCNLNFPGAANSSLRLTVIGKLGLAVGTTVTAKFSPYQIKERSMRAISIE